MSRPERTSHSPGARVATATLATLATHLRPAGASVAGVADVSVATGTGAETHSPDCSAIATPEFGSGYGYSGYSGYATDGDASSVARVATVSVATRPDDESALGSGQRAPGASAAPRGASGYGKAGYGGYARSAANDDATLIEAFEERAGILQFDAGLPRLDAERLAWDEVVAEREAAMAEAAELLARVRGTS